MRLVGERSRMASFACGGLVSIHFFPVSFLWIGRGLERRLHSRWWQRRGIVVDIHFLKELGMVLLNCDRVKFREDFIGGFSCCCAFAEGQRDHGGANDANDDRNK